MKIIMVYSSPVHQYNLAKHSVYATSLDKNAEDKEGHFMFILSGPRFPTELIQSMC